MAPNTGRNAECNRVAFLLGGLVADAQHGLSATSVQGALLGACQRNGLVEDDGERSVLATINSGYQAGVLQAWSPADQEEPRPVVSTNGHTVEHGARLSIVRMSDVRPEPIEWHWRGRFARGKPTLLMGDPGLGKSLITHWLAARTSTGGEW